MQATDARPALPLHRAVSPGLLALFLAQALATGATTASTALASLVMAGLGREALSGLPSTLLTLGAALSAGLFGTLMLRAGRRAGLVSAYLLGGAGAVLGFAGARAGLVPVFLLGAALVGAAQGGYQQARYAVAESVPEGVRGAVLGALMLASVAGSAGSTALSGVLLSAAARLHTSGEVVGWLLAAAFLLLGAGLTALWRPERRSEVARALPAGPAPVALPTSMPLRAVLSDPAVRWPALAVVSAQGLMVTLMSLTPLRAHHLGLDHLHVAGLVTVHIAGMFGFGWLTGPLLDRLGRGPSGGGRGERVGFGIGGALLVTAALLSLGGGGMQGMENMDMGAGAGTVGAARGHAGGLLGVSMFVLGLGWNFCFVAGSKALTRNRSAQGRVDSLSYLVGAFGTLLGGLVIARLGFPALAGACALLGLLPVLSAAAPGHAGTAGVDSRV